MRIKDIITEVEFDWYLDKFFQPNYFYRKYMGATNVVFNFDIRVWRVNHVLLFTGLRTPLWIWTQTMDSEKSAMNHQCKLLTVYTVYTFYALFLVVARVFLFSMVVKPNLFPVIPGFFGCHVTRNGCWENSFVNITLGSTPPPLVHMTRIALGMRLQVNSKILCFFH